MAAWWFFILSSFKSYREVKYLKPHDNIVTIAPTVYGLQCARHSTPALNTFSPFICKTALLFIYLLFPEEKSEVYIK